MLPTSMAMPSAGRTVPNTSAEGTCTTKMSNEVKVRTLTKMLKPSPKKALVSPRVHHGLFSAATGCSAESRRVRFMGSPLAGTRCSAGERGGTKGRDDRGRVGHPSEDPALRGDHVQPHPLELRKVRPDAVRYDNRLVAAVIRFSDGGVHADLRGHPGHHELSDSCRLQDIL